jgi:hypothetical protein
VEYWPEKREIRRTAQAISGVPRRVGSTHIQRGDGPEEEDRGPEQDVREKQHW